VIHQNHGDEDFVLDNHDPAGTRRRGCGLAFLCLLREPIEPYWSILYFGARHRHDTTQALRPPFECHRPVQLALYAAQDNLRSKAGRRWTSHPRTAAFDPGYD
jgi:hypothetical protein